MRPGKLFRPTKKSVPIFPVDSSPSKVYRLPWKFIDNNETFLVVSVETAVTRKFQLDPKSKLRHPWLVLHNEAVYVADIYGCELMDLTPWPAGHPNSIHNAELIEHYKQHVK